MSKTRLQSIAFQAFMALFLLMGLSACGRGVGFDSGFRGLGGGRICTLIGYITFSVSVTSQDPLDPSSLTLLMSHNNGPFREVGEAERNYPEVNTFGWGFDPEPGLYKMKVRGRSSESEEKSIVLLAATPANSCGPRSQPAQLTFTLP